jgi:hypothetical protein
VTESPAQEARKIAEVWTTPDPGDRWYPPMPQDAVKLARAHFKLLSEQGELRELARSARNTAAAPDYDEEAIRDALWALVDAVLAPVEAAIDEGER